MGCVDTELARTFLEIVSTRSFVRAAERLNVGQTTVSARILLELFALKLPYDETFAEAA